MFVQLRVDVLININQNNIIIWVAIVVIGVNNKGWVHIVVGVQMEADCFEQVFR